MARVDWGGGNLKWAGSKRWEWCWTGQVRLREQRDSVRTLLYRLVVFAARWTFFFTHLLFQHLIGRRRNSRAAGSRTPPCSTGRPVCGVSVKSSFLHGGRGCSIELGGGAATLMTSRSPLHRGYHVSHFLCARWMAFGECVAICVFHVDKGIRSTCVRNPSMFFFGMPTRLELTRTITTQA